MEFLGDNKSYERNFPNYLRTLYARRFLLPINSINPLSPLAVFAQATFVTYGLPEIHADFYASSIRVGSIIGGGGKRGENSISTGIHARLERSSIIDQPSFASAEKRLK